jgi:cyclopropane fatty-acyl-phospholipid synthase-like methyltransferase
MTESDALRRVRGLLAFLKVKSVKTILQAGCGDREVTSLLINAGFDVTVVDEDGESLAGLEAALDADGLSAELIKASVCELPAPGRCFDFALAWNTLYYSNYEGLAHSLAALFNQLRDDGFFYLTLISTKHADFGRGEKVEQDTFNLEGSLRHFSAGGDMVALLRHVEVIDLRDEEQGEPGSFHWHILGRNRDLAPPEEDEEA